MPLRPLSVLRAAVRSGPPYEETLIAELRGDPRASAQALCAACSRRIGRAEAEAARCDAMWRFEREVQAEGFARIAGVDEAGRGPLAGPIVAAAVILTTVVHGLNDSKQLTAHQRESLFAELHTGGHSIGSAIVSSETIDLYGIQSANYSAMIQAVARIDPPPDFLLVDGFSILGCRVPHRAIIKGDSRSQSVAAASIIAKVVRDRIMVELDRLYPEYGFAHHKGYGTPDHLDALRRLGPCPAHRKTFAPVASPPTENCRKDLFSCEC
jgi:ribonuclease HII